MKIIRAEQRVASGGFRNLCFLKLTADNGLVGWSEFSHSSAAPALDAMIASLSRLVIGQDPFAIGRITASLRALTHANAGGMVGQAIGAIENACLDLKAKALGVPVYELFGGAIRKRLPLYWSHCATFRLLDPDTFARGAGKPAIRSLEDLTALGREVAESGYRALKTNMFLCGADSVPQPYFAGAGYGPGGPELNLDKPLATGIQRSLAALAKGAGPAVGLMLDVNFNLRPEGLRQLARLVEPFNLTWLEVDSYDPRALAGLRRVATVPIASLENIYGARGALPFFLEDAVDVAIVDPQWNGLSEALRIASLADSFGINVAAHNFHSLLSTMIGAHFSAVLPNFRIMEHDVDEVPWTAELFSHPLEIEDGELILPDRPGWGIDVNEDALAAHPPLTGIGA